MSAPVSTIDVLVPKMAAAAALLRVLASPIRLTVLAELQAGPHCVHELVTACGASQSLVSQHLRVLRCSRLVSAERQGREVMYSLTDSHVAHIVGDALNYAEEAQ